VAQKSEGAICIAMSIDILGGGKSGNDDDDDDDDDADKKLFVRVFAGVPQMCQTHGWNSSSNTPTLFSSRNASS
jgi:hypothetical protein